MAATEGAKPERGGYLLLASIILAGLFLPQVVTTRPQTPPQTQRAARAAPLEAPPTSKDLQELLEAHFPEYADGRKPFPVLVAALPDPSDSQVGWLSDGLLESLERAFEAEKHRFREPDPPRRAARRRDHGRLPSQGPGDGAPAGPGAPGCRRARGGPRAHLLRFHP